MSELHRGLTEEEKEMVRTHTKNMTHDENVIDTFVLNVLTELDRRGGSSLIAKRNMFKSMVATVEQYLKDEDSYKVEYPYSHPIIIVNDE